MLILSLEFWNSKKVQNCIVLALLVIVSVWAYWYTQNYERHIRQHQKTGIAFVFKLDLEGRYKHKRAWFIIKDMNGNRQDTSYELLDEFSYNLFHKLNNRTFPIVYDSTNYRFNCILLKQSDFWKYGLQYPDSLMWLQKLIDEDNGW